MPKGPEPGAGELWKVVGGAKSGGIMVRFGMDKDSPACKDRLATGAVIKQVKLSGERLNYEKVEGDGPDKGWVSLKFKDADMVVKVNPDKEIMAAYPSCQDGFLEFPKDFAWGLAACALQIEGAGTEGGRRASIWEEYCQQEGKVLDGATPNVACDHYHRWETDLNILQKLNMKHYRLSISWCRLMPEGNDVVNETAVEFYNKVIDGLLARGITPWVTLYHWDLPLVIHRSFGGWLGPKEKITEAFGHYCRTCYERFGDRVKHWFTLNEPGCCSILGYAKDGKFAPGFQENSQYKEGEQEYICGHNMLLAHAEGYRIYKSEFKEAQKGKVGIAFNASFWQPRNPGKSEDVAAARRGMEFELGWFCNPIYINGDYPQSMREKAKDRLPKFTSAEKALLKGSCDFFGINNYMSYLAKNLTEARQQGFRFDFRGLQEDREAYQLLPDEKQGKWAETDMSWPICPWGFRDLLIYIHETFHPPGGIIVTENGTAHERDQCNEYEVIDGAIVEKKDVEGLVPRAYNESNPPEEDFDNETYDDPDRCRYYKMHIAGMHAAINKGADVRGYFGWSLMDNFEWEKGYHGRFGVVRVDYPTQKRTIKASGRLLAEVSKRNGLDAPPKEEEYPGLKW